MSFEQREQPEVKEENSSMLMDVSHPEPKLGKVGNIKVKGEPSSQTQQGSEKKGKKESLEQPLFLRKAYAMINACPSELGGWSAAGNSFIVHDPDLFAEKIIPTFYRHSNWASFVRQLNFYGFRKIKSEVFLSAEIPPWEFAHPCFLRGRPELLSEIIRKVGPQDSSGENGREIQELRGNVRKLTEQFNAMNDLVTSLSTQMKSMSLRLGVQESESDFPRTEPLQLSGDSRAPLNTSVDSVPTEAGANTPVAKKRKYVRKEKTPTRTAVTKTDPPVTADSGTTTASGPLSSPNDLSLFDMSVEGELFSATNASSLEVQPLTRSTSELLDVLCDFDDYDSSLPSASAPVAPSPTTLLNNEGVTADTISGILQQLDVKLQERFVDKLAHVVGTLLVKNGNAADILQQMSTQPAQTQAEAVSLPPAALPLSQGTKAAAVEPVATAEVSGRTLAVPTVSNKSECVTVVSPSSSVIFQGKLAKPGASTTAPCVASTSSQGSRSGASSGRLSVPPAAAGLSITLPAAAAGTDRGSTTPGLTPSTGALVNSCTAAQDSLQSQSQALAEDQNGVLQQTELQKVALYGFILNVLQANTSLLSGDGIRI